ncbi:pepsin-like aspartic protease [Celerinatantimonas yamalensis]|uniref:Pepsin-like aspartic protease n=1 Tax=Celerinatantimonas yamalensis TaxID=559956 RepID=A0ABW9GAS9_9GAMM
MLEREESTDHSGNESGLSLPLYKGPFQNNGASPWYVKMGVGTPAQPLKFSFDTGSNFNWVTSSLCSPSGCKHYGNERFFEQRSHSFRWVNDSPTQVDFGPWGSMQVQSGHDYVEMKPAEPHLSPRVATDLYLSQEYTGQQFAELDWDGGIGLPSYSYQPVDVPHSQIGYRGLHSTSAQPSFHFMETLLAQGVINAQQPFVSFDTDPQNARGQVVFGGLDASYAQSREYLFLPWKRYDATPAVASLYYIWTTELESLAIADKTLCSRQSSSTPLFFCLDSGSSQFKGDPEVMFNAYQYASLLGGDLTLTLGSTDTGALGKLCITEALYNVQVEAGEFAGLQVPQFEPMQGLDALVLVGSVLMDYLYTVYEYQVVVDSLGSQKLEPVGMWIFNKQTGPQIIQSRQNQPAQIFHKGY